MQSFSYSSLLNELQVLEIKKGDSAPPQISNTFGHSCARLADLIDLTSSGKLLFTWLRA